LIAGLTVVDGVMDGLDLRVQIEINRRAKEAKAMKK